MPPHRQTAIAKTISNRTTALFLLALSVAIFPTVSKVTAAEPVWGQWRGPARDGTWKGTLPVSLDELDLAWEQDLKPSYSGPVTDGEVVYTTETVDESYEQVSAFELSTGKRLWTSRWEGAISVPPYAAANGSWIRSTPALAKDSLVILGMRDELICLDRVTGDNKWKVDLADRFKARRPPFGGVCSPLIDGNAVYVMGGGGTVKLSLANGETIWRTLADEGEDDDAFSSPVIATISGMRQLVVQTRTRLCGVDLDDGNVLWQVPIDAYRNMNVLTPTVIGNRVFTAAHSGGSHCFDVEYKDDRWNVEEVWKQTLQAYMSSPVADGGTIYLHSKNGRLTAIDLETGNSRWTSRPMGKYQSLVRNEEVILGLSSDGELTVIEANPSELVIRSRKQVANEAWAYLGVFHGGLLVRDLDSLKVFRY